MRLRSLSRCLLPFVVLLWSPVAGAAPLLNHEQKLNIPDPDVGDRFGSSVAVSGTTAIVGATQFGGDAYGPGQALIYQRDWQRRGVWGEVQQLGPVPGQLSDRFGTAVAIDGDIAAVGASRDDDTAENSGAVYVFARDEGGLDNWGLVKKLKASDAGLSHEFGGSVAIDGDRLVVGAENAGDGAAYIFERNEGGPDNWGEVAKLTTLDLGGDFGSCVAVAGDTVVIGMERHFNVPEDEHIGAAFIHVRDQGGAGAWGLVKRIEPGIVALTPNMRFGDTCDVDGDTTVIGASTQGQAYAFDRNSGGPSNWGEVKRFWVSGVQAGGYGVAVEGDTIFLGFEVLTDEIVRVFDRDEGGADNWGAVYDLTASDPVDGNRFGRAVAISGDAVFVGAAGGPEDLGSAYAFTRRGVPMFVTTADHPADFGGLAGGDAICQADADAASLPGLWRSFLSVTGITRFSRLPSSLPIERIDRVLLADDSVDLDGPIDAPLEIDASGATAPIGTHVWTGDESGAGSCVDFTATGGDVGTYGITSETTTSWHDDGDDACTESNRLYCFRSVCPATASAGCDESWQKATLVVKETKVGKEKLKIDLKNGPALDQLDFGNPVDPGGTRYMVCLYDDADTLIAQFDLDRAGDLCGGKPCWLPIGGFPPEGTGYQYRDKELSADGLQQLKFKGGAAGKSKIQIRAANNAAKGYDSLQTMLTDGLELATAATVQVHGDDLTPCQAATLTDVRRTTRDFFHARK